MYMWLDVEMCLKYLANCKHNLLALNFRRYTVSPTLNNGMECDKGMERNSGTEWNCVESYLPYSKLG